MAFGLETRATRGFRLAAFRTASPCFSLSRGPDADRYFKSESEDRPNGTEHWHTKTKHRTWVMSGALLCDLPRQMGGECCSADRWVTVEPVRLRSGVRYLRTLEEPYILTLLCALFCQGVFGLGGQDWVEQHRVGGRLL